MNYIGSKFSLLKNIENIIKEYGLPGHGIALDLFSGTGVVSQLFKSIGYITYANDWQYYSYCVTASYLTLNDFPSFERLLESDEWKIIKNAKDELLRIYSLNHRNQRVQNESFIKVLSYLQDLKGKKGEFYHNYCEGGGQGRLYFSIENGKKIQEIRDKIEDWHKKNLINLNEKIWLIACLLESADRIANTASVYGAYLKKIKKTAEKHLEMIGIKPVESKFSPEVNKVFCTDSLKLLRRLKNEDILLTYIDPPYNRRQYSANYHILETIAKWDIEEFIPRGVTGLRNKSEFISNYSLRTKAERAFDELFSQINSRYILLSYNNEGLITEDFIRNLFDTYCKDYKFEKIEYQRYRADVDHSKRIYKTDNTTEYLIIGKKK